MSSDYYQDYNTSATSPRHRNHRTSDYDDTRSRDYSDREKPYETLYRRSFDTNVPDNRLAPYSPGEVRPRSVSRSRYYNDESTLSPPLDSGRRRHQSARPRSRSRSGASRERSKSRGRYDEESESGVVRRLSGNFGKERKDMAASVVGAVVGGFLGHEADKRKGGGMHQGVATLGGAVLGGLAGNAIEHRHLKHDEERRYRRDSDRDDYEDDERSSSRYRY